VRPEANKSTDNAACNWLVALAAKKSPAPAELSVTIELAEAVDEVADCSSRETFFSALKVLTADTQPLFDTGCIKVAIAIPFIAGRAHTDNHMGQIRRKFAHRFRLFMMKRTRSFFNKRISYISLHGWRLNCLESKRNERKYRKSKAGTTKGIEKWLELPSG
jgi:hypothetical protein